MLICMLIDSASRVLLGSTTTRTVLDEDVDEEVFEDSLNSPLKYQRDSIGDNPSLPPTWTHRSSSNKINLGITVNTGVTTTSSSSNAITSSGKNSLTSPRQLLAKKKQNSFVEITQNLPIAGSPSSLRR